MARPCQELDQSFGWHSRVRFGSKANNGGWPGGGAYGGVPAFSFGDSAIIQWQDVPFHAGSGASTFQAILDDRGGITFQYRSMTGAVNSATVGIQNADRTAGLEVALNQAYLHDELAVRIASIPRWLTVLPATGRLGAGESKLINVHMAASGLEGGAYPGAVHVLTNDPAHPDLIVSASLQVTGAPQVIVQPASLAYGDVFTGVATIRDLIVANGGTDTLHVSDVTPSDAALAPSRTTMSIPVIWR